MHASTQPQADLPADLSWRAHPVRQRPGRAVVAIALIAGLGVAAGLMGGGPWWGIAAAAVMLISLNRFFLPSRFVIDAEGITASYPLRRQRMKWVDLRRFGSDRWGGFLSTRARGGWTDSVSGMHVLFAEDHEPIVAAIRGRMPERFGDQPVDQAGDQTGEVPA